MIEKNHGTSVASGAVEELRDLVVRLRQEHCWPIETHLLNVQHLLAK